MKPIILDVDTGIDDMMAIAYAAHSPEVKLIGVTTLFGNVTVEEATRNSLYVLELLGREDVPVYAGAEEPLSGNKDAYAKHVHGEDGLGGAMRDALPKGQAASLTAPQFMVEQARSMPGQLTIISVGPMTNLAKAIRSDPEFVRVVGQVIIMGGAVTVPGNVTPYAEANIHSDPEAAEFVFGSGLPIKLVGLDVTMKTLLPRTRLQEWRDQGSKLSHFLADATDFYIDAYETFSPGIGGCALHDPLAVGIVIDPTFCRTESLPVRVDTEGMHTVGRTYADRNALPNERPSIEVCLEVDADRFLAHFLSRVV
ncbi:nucleoside hydrolase [Paenibacillus paeoniae]|uniref:Nucleoside hydrolase n=1 Tax=Paenibacillus paeoniae TaxID=2292705 RepID=A0A371PN01_9BACL|nr:nucleoside hydrolase [Paenibacillus paeoniae]REK77513.1 nucleoside hydrolase [Paenibacillus paeoniae]